MKVGKIDLSALTQRERWFLLGGGGAALLLLLYFFIWVPFSDELNSLKEIATNQLVSSEWMKKSLAEIQQFKANGLLVEEVKKENLLSIVEALLTKQALNDYVDKVQEREGKIAVNFQEVPFDKMMEWLQVLWTNYAVSVDQISVKKGKEEGTVGVEVMLKKSK